jgi:hypothetical protein
MLITTAPLFFLYFVSIGISFFAVRGRDGQESQVASH